jgi:hypothetical protein
LIVAEQARVRGLDYLTGEDLWQLDAERGRSLSSLGVRDGVLHVLSEAATRSDGGRILGVEPTSGATMFRRAFHPLRDSVEPVATASGIYALDPGRRDASVAIERFDAVTGELVSRTPLSTDVLSFLRLDGEQAYRLHTPSVQTSFFADERAIYLHVDGTDVGDDTRIVSIDYDGKQLHTWQGKRGSTIKMLAPRDDKIVVLERLDQLGWITVLDRRLQPMFDEQLGPKPTAVNWVSSAARQDAPPRLLIQSGSLRNGRASDSVTFRCYELASGRRGGFRFTVRNTTRVLPQPILGADFVTVPCARAGSTKARIQVLSKSGRSALPGGAAELTLALNRPLNMFQYGQYTIVETLEAILVLGGP